MQPKSKRLETLLWALAVLAIIVVGAIAIGLNPWMIVILVIVYAFGMWAVSNSGLSGNP